MESNSLISIWSKPKEIIRHLYQSSLSHYQLMLILTLIYFVQAGAFILSLEKITLAPLLSLDGLKLILWFFVLVGIRSVIFIYASSFAIWVAAKCFKSQGTLPQTRGAIIWTLISTIPIGFFLLLINFAFKHPNLGSLAIIIRIGSYAGILATLIYGSIVLFKTVAQLYRFDFWRTFFSIVLGLILLSALLFAGWSYLF